MRGTLAQRLDALTAPDPNSGCWLFFGCCDNKGYGQIQLGGRYGGVERTHRAAWIVAFGPIPKGLCVLHKCDTPCCVNPDHLFLGTVADNSRDMARKNRGTKGRLPYGVRFKGGLFFAQIGAKIKRRHVGTFRTLEEAAAAALAAKMARLAGEG
jgi:hypothetical protein